MMRKAVVRVGLLFATGVLYGCGGGGSNTVTYAPFQDRSSLAAGSNVEFSGGRSFEGSYTWNTTTEKLTAFSGSNQTGSKVLIQYGASYPGSLADSTVTLDPGNTAFGNVVVDCSTGTCGAITAANDYAVAANAAGEDYAISADNAGNMEYMVYGYWVTGGGTGSGNVGTFTNGVETAASNMPSSGTASYTGTLTGGYIEADGTDYAIIGDVSASVNFAAGTFSFSTTNTEKTRDLITFNSDANLNLTASGTITSGTNEFTGTSASTVGANIKNIALQGDFFGPAAANMGGLITGADSGTFEAYQAAFGATQ